MRYLILFLVFLTSHTVLADDMMPAKPVIIDTHNHLHGFLTPRESDFLGAAGSAIKTMDRFGIQTSIVMPPPQTPGQHGAYTYKKLLSLKQQHGPRLAFLGGGGTLNVMIQENLTTQLTQKTISHFKSTAHDIAKSGAVGFGEMAALHFSLNPKHPVVMAPADHPLFKILSDVAAEHDLPIDLHMEAVVKKRALPKHLKAPPNPPTLTPTIGNLKRLLEHNPKTKIVWAHLGWDCTGERTPTLCANLFKEHPNLYMSLRVPPTIDKQSLKATRLLDEDGKLKDEWKTFIVKHADRLVLGSDEFFLSPRSRMKRHPSEGSVKGSSMLLKQLPKEVVQKIAVANPQKIYHWKNH